MDNLTILEKTDRLAFTCGFPGGDAASYVAILAALGLAYVVLLATLISFDVFRAIKGRNRPGRRDK